MPGIEVTRPARAGARCMKKNKTKNIKPGRKNKSVRMRFRTYEITMPRGAKFLFNSWDGPGAAPSSFSDFAYMKNGGPIEKDTPEDQIVRCKVREVPRRTGGASGNYFLWSEIMKDLVPGIKESTLNTLQDMGFGASDTDIVDGEKVRAYTAADVERIRWIHNYMQSKKCGVRKAVEAYKLAHAASYLGFLRRGYGNEEAAREQWMQDYGKMHSTGNEATPEAAYSKAVQNINLYDVHRDWIPGKGAKGVESRGWRLKKIERMTADGKSNAVIAAYLGITERCVRKHKQTIKKLERRVHEQAEARADAAERERLNKNDLVTAFDDIDDTADDVDTDNT
jgi:hypothetical protein